jgi:SAM-dependent methyltransferase
VTTAKKLQSDARDMAKKAADSAKPYVPVSVKRPVKRAIPQRYWHLLDPDWHRRTIGNFEMWDELGQLQFDFMVDKGLKPEHKLLDVGCGPLRGGIKFIQYLEPGNYYGVDKREDVIDESIRLEVPANGLEPRRPTLRAIGDFGFHRLGTKFEFALAQSVFTHLPLNAIIRCLVNMDDALVEGGVFYATFFLNEEGRKNLDDIHQTDQVVTHFDRDFYHYDVASMEWACEGTGLVPEYLGGWNNPRNSKMMSFTKRS